MTEQTRPLLLTADSELLDDLLGLAAAVGVAVDVGVEPSACGPQWMHAPLVLVGADLADALADARLPARPAVLVVARDGPVDGLQDAVASVGAEEVIALDGGEGLLLDRLADTAEPATRAQVLAVVAGRGGAGASVLAAALALTAATDGPAWLVDLDTFGGGADVGMGAELSAGARWADLSLLTGRLSPAALRRALPRAEGVAMVTGSGRAAADPAPEAVRAVLAAMTRGAGTVVVDLPRHRTPARDEAVAAADELLVVVPTELRAVVAAGQVLGGLGPTSAAVRAVLRRVPDGLPAREILRVLALPSAGELPDEAQVRTALHTGEAAGLLRAPALSHLCRSLLGSPGRTRVAA